MNYFRKLLKIILLISMIIISSIKLNTSAQNIPVYLDEQELELSNEVFIENGIVMVPLRAIGEALGYNVDWNGLNQSIIIHKPGQVSYSTFGINSSYVGTFYGRTIIDVAPRIVENRTYLPLRALAESLGENISWDENSKSVYILKNPKYNGIESNISKNGYLPQIVNPSASENKINENILLKLSIDKDKSSNLLTKEYEYDIKNNQSNILSILYGELQIFNKVVASLNYPEDYCYSCDTFYKNTGKKLTIEDILKGSKEEIEKIIIDAYEKHDGKVVAIGKGLAGPGIQEYYSKYNNTYLINNYDFYIEDNNLVIMIIIPGHDTYLDGISTFRINMVDNASLFKEEFLQNFSDALNSH